MRDDLALYEQMLLIRRFEERLLEEFSTGRLVGTTHAYIGQEADAAAVFDALDPEDIVFSNHRCHGHFIAYGGDLRALTAELMGRATGLVGGRGGSQHIQWRNFYSNGIQGGTTPVAAGMALAEKLSGSGRIAVAFLGDGTLGEGVLYESLNIAALWSLPVLYVVEDNRYAQTTPIALGVAGTIAGRFAAFGIPAYEIDSTDVLAIRPVAVEAVAAARSGKPAALILHTFRFAAHSKGDDVRAKEEVAGYRKFDPLTIHGERIPAAARERLERDVAERIEAAFAQAAADPDPDPAGLVPLPERLP